MTVTALFGGSFNPAHGGHRCVTLYAMKALGVDETWWLVSPGNPLKPAKGMAPLLPRYKSAKSAARRTRIKPTVIEQALGTRFTVDTLKKIKRRYPKRRFIWVMGADNLAQFHQWRDWHSIARLMPIAVIARPGYDSKARAAVAMGWFKGHVHPQSHAQRWTDWRPPALVLLRFRPDKRSATALRRDDPDWFQTYSQTPVRDTVTRLLIK
jgi:nicotinate-nucleotide adenylyltransferase